MQTPAVIDEPVVLASASPYRARLLVGLVAEVHIDAPEVDERALDPMFEQLGAARFALELARRKAAVVAGRHPGALVLAGDQVGVLERDGILMQLTKQLAIDSAVAQLLAMSGSTHRLVNALVVERAGTGRRVEGIDEVEVTMRRFDASEARDYVERFTPFDTAGSYRLEDGDAMAPLAPFVTSVVAEHDSGVLGLPLPLLARMLAEPAVSGPDPADPPR